MAGIYVHIPFCKSRCIYCGFYSTTRLAERSRYVDALLRELDMRRSYLRESVHSLYIGGGTPSQLSLGDLQKLHEALVDVCPDPDEFTMECNPDDVTPQLAEWIGQGRINRVSLGVQSFDDERLHMLHRRHTAAQARRAVCLLRDAGIENISIDLMFGFPGETLDDWRNDLHEAVALGVEHISAYSLMYEEGTVLGDMLERGVVEEIDEDLSAQMYDLLIDTLVEAGYEHYEISNFCRPGKESRHNSSYWRLVPYLGLGAGAHSFDGNQRCWNPDDINKYVDAITDGRLPLEYDETGKDVLYNDLVTTALRTRRGIDLAWLANKLGNEYREYLLSSAQKHLAQGNLTEEAGHLRLTRKGLYVSDTVMSDMIMLRT